MSSSQGPANADWSDFEPRPYLDLWYARVTPEITATVGFLIRAYQQLAPQARMIDFCSGPTIYQHIAAAPYVAAIDVCDYLTQNLAEIRRWQAAEPSAFDWTPIIAEALRLEGRDHASAADIAGRAELVRAKLAQFAFCDIRQPHPLGADIGRPYDVVSHCYGADVIAHSVEEWEACVRHTCSVLKPGGTLLMTLIKEAQWWPSGEQILHAVALNERHVAAALARIGFEPTRSVIETHTVADAATEGYSEVLFVNAILGSEPPR